MFSRSVRRVRVGVAGPGLNLAGVGLGLGGYWVGLAGSELDLRFRIRRVDLVSCPIRSCACRVELRLRHFRLHFARAVPREV